MKLFSGRKHQEFFFNFFFFNFAKSNHRLTFLEKLLGGVSKKQPLSSSSAWCASTSVDDGICKRRFAGVFWGVEVLAATSVLVPMTWSSQASSQTLRSRLFKKHLSRSNTSSWNNCESGAWRRNIAINPNDEATISSSVDAFPWKGPPSTVSSALRLILTISSGKRAGSLFLEKYFGGRSPHTLLLSTYHVLLGSKSCGLLTQEKGEEPFLGAIDPRKIPSTKLHYDLK